MSKQYLFDEQPWLHIESVVVADGIFSIDRLTFFLCKNMTTISLPASLKHIRERAFVDCYKLSDIYYDGTRQQWEEVLRFSQEHHVSLHYESYEPDIPVGCRIHCKDGTHVRQSLFKNALCSINPYMYSVSNGDGTSGVSFKRPTKSERKNMSETLIIPERTPFGELISSLSSGYIDRSKKRSTMITTFKAL